MKSYVPERGLRLFPVAIQGTETPHVESMASFICAAAIEHRRSPIQFLVSILDYSLSPGHSYARHLANADGCTINGYGLSQRRVVSALTRGFGPGDFVQLCLGQVGEIFAPKGGRVVKTSRHWCPSCYREQRHREVRAYDLLMWQLAELTDCPQCFGSLTNSCWQCRARQLPLPRSGRMDLCATCGAWLGEQLIAATGEAKESAYQRWLVRTIEKLLVERTAISKVASGFEPARFLISVMESRQVSSEVLANQIQMPLDTLTQWVRRRNKPTFTSWLRACVNLGADFSETLLDPVRAAHQLQLPFESGRVYRPTRTKPHRKYDKESVKEAIRAELLEGGLTVTSVRELAERLGMPDSMLFFHEPTGVKELSALLRRKAQNAKRSRACVILKSARRVTARMSRDGVPMLRKTFVQELMKRTGCSIRCAKDLFPVVMAEFKAPRPTSREASDSEVLIALSSGESGL